MIQALALILVLLWAGYALAQAFSLPIPGPVIGLLGLFLLLRAGLWRGDAGLEPVADGLIRFLPLFFVPAGVGLILHLDRIGQDGLAIALALGPGTVLALAATAWLMRRLSPPTPKTDTDDLGGPM